MCDRHDEATMMRDVQTLIDVILGLVPRISASHEMWLGAKKVSILCDKHRKRIGGSEREFGWVFLLSKGRNTERRQKRSLSRLGS